MRLLLTVNTTWNLANFRAPLIAALRADGHEVIALAPPDESTAVIESMGCRFVPLRMDQSGLSPVRDAALLLDFVRHFRDLRPDAVLSFTIKNNLYGGMAARLLGVPFVPTITGLGTAFLSSRALRLVAETLYRSAFAGVPFVVFQNADDRAHFVSRRLVRDAQVRLAPGSGIDLDYFRPRTGRPGGRPTFLLIARMLRDKGVVEFAEAARMVRVQHPEVRFELLGPLGYDNRSALDPAVVEGWVSEGLLRFHGSVDDVRPYIDDAHCVVLPSYREGAPRTLLEAAAMGRPLIATDVPGCRNVVDHGVTGLLCEARSAESLRDSMLAFIALPPKAREEMGLAGRRKMEAEFGVSRVIDAYRQILASVQEHGARRPPT